ncbi:hypothetical protein ES707_15243 [subsurface metagenome]
MVREEFIGHLGLFRSPPEPVGGRLDRTARATKHQIIRAAQSCKEVVRDGIQRDTSRHSFCTRSTLGMIRVVQFRWLNITAYLQAQFGGVGLGLKDFNRVLIAGPKPSGGLWQVADRGRQAHAPRWFRRHRIDTAQETGQMKATRSLQKRM